LGWEGWHLRSQLPSCQRWLASPWPLLPVAVMPAAAGISLASAPFRRFQLRWKDGVVSGDSSLRWKDGVLGESHIA